MEFFQAAIVSIALVGITTLMFYELMRWLWQLMPHIMQHQKRHRILLLIFSIFAGHTAAVWVYGIAFWVLDQWGGIGHLTSTSLDVAMGDIDFLEYIYFSVVTYSSLGFGDVLPHGGLRLVAGVEVLNGLILIGWSISITYLGMEKFWERK